MIVRSIASVLLALVLAGPAQGAWVLSHRLTSPPDDDPKAIFTGQIVFSGGRVFVGGQRNDGELVAYALDPATLAPTGTVNEPGAPCYHWHAIGDELLCVGAKVDGDSLTTGDAGRVFDTLTVQAKRSLVYPVPAISRPAGAGRGCVVPRFGHDFGVSAADLGDAIAVGSPEDDYPYCSGNSAFRDMGAVFIFDRV